VFVRTLREYAASLEEENLSGRAVLWVFIDAEGRVGNTRVVESSGQTLVDAVALAAIREARFEPARNRDAAVPVWIQLPIVVGGGP
jgi:TonB family protein